MIMPKRRGKVAIQGIKRAGTWEKERETLVSEETDACRMWRSLLRSENFQLFANKLHAASTVGGIALP
eukprot:1021415-Pleurochrysis_carterae.AAC.3